MLVGGAGQAGSWKERLRSWTGPASEWLCQQEAERGTRGGRNPDLRAGGHGSLPDFFLNGWGEWGTGQRSSTMGATAGGEDDGGRGHWPAQMATVE